MANIGIQLEREVAEVKDKINRVFAMSVIQFTNELAIGTPVDTGYARAGWRIDTTNDGFKPPPLGKEERAQRRKAKSGGSSPAPVYNLPEFNFADLGPSVTAVYIFNNADYISYLEGLNGVTPVSPQAPDGWIRETLDRWPLIVQSQIGAVGL